MKEIFSDPVFIALAFIVPLAVTFLFGYGLSLDVKNMPVVFLDQDSSPLSRDYIYSFTNSEYFRLAGLSKDMADLDSKMRSGKARVGIVIPPDFSRKLYKGHSTEVQVLVDGSFPMRAMTAQGYVSAVDAQFNQKMVSQYLSRAGGQSVAGVYPIAVEGRAWYNPSLESKNFMIPGLLVLTLIMYPPMLVVLAIVREKELGTIFNLYCSPVRRWEVVFGKAIPYIAIVFINYLMIFTLSVLLFKVRFTGSFLLLSAGALLYIASTVGLGLCISVLSRSQIAAMLLSFIVIMLPSFMFSGFMAPITSMDATGQFISRFIPASYFMGMVRGIYLKGLGFSYYKWDLASLAVYAVIVYGIFIISFKKRIA
jgi:ABC-2 type transport system permease protein